MFGRILLFLVLALTGCSHSLKSKNVAQPKNLSKQAPYYIPVPIIKQSAIQSPCVDVCIEDHVFSVELDLGFCGDLILNESDLNIIHSKKFLRKKTLYGMRGKEYCTKLFEVPKIKIGNMTFLNAPIQEESEQFSKDSTFIPHGETEVSHESGRLGWELFSRVNLLIDLQRSLVAFCDSLETLANHGYNIHLFSKSPMILDRGFVELDVEIAAKTVRCVLDTGATVNMLNCGIEETRSIDEMLWDLRNTIQYSSFKISGTEAGPITFRKVPIKIPIQIEAILGMDFFKTHLIFLDFKQGWIYFANI